MGTLATMFYKNLYTSEGVIDMEKVLKTVPTEVMPEKNDLLLAPFDSKEVKEALFQMFPTKGRMFPFDGFPAHCFQRQWKLCGEVFSVVMRVLRGKDYPARITNTLRVLIPKVM